MQNWVFYQANINDNIASVYLDLNAKLNLRNKNLTNLCWLFIKLNIEREDGLSHDDEFESLCQYEDDIEEAIKGSGVHYVGRITTQGMRQFYFYSELADSFENAIDKAISLNQDYLFQIGTQQDEGWSQFDNVLYPGEYGLSQINERVSNT